ncbi:MAG TPA: LptA/OstA family protein [Candidatus Goldiibacteriota bacterium]|nr:LptA/OstA family protein [Candidatus Goldiibacteriota bacterium]
MDETDRKFMPAEPLKTQAEPLTQSAKPGPVTYTGDTRQAKVYAPEGTAEKKREKRFRIRELEVASDKLSFNKETSITVFSGNVILASQGFTMKCDRLSSKNYKDNAEASGNVRAYFKEQKTRLYCDTVIYGERMKSVSASGNVRTEKYLDNGNTITMWSDKMDFDTETGRLEAKKERKKVKVVYKDITAFGDRLVYDNDNSVMEMTGRPAVKKAGSGFVASKITIDTLKKTMKMERDIWSRLFYGDLKKTEEEVKLETDKDRASGKNIQ